MSWENDYLELMPRTVNLFPKATATNNWVGVPTMGDAQPVRAKIKPMTQEIRDNNGETRLAAGNIWCPPPGAMLDETPIGPVAMPTTDWKITIPGVVTLAEIVKIEPVDDEEGLHHLKVFYG